MQNWYLLKFNGQFLHDNLLNFNENFDFWHTIKYKIEDSLSKEGIDFLKTINFYPLYSNLFCGGPNLTSRIHIDNFHQSYAINFVWNVEESYMMWYHVENLYQNREKRLTTANTPYISFDPNISKEHERVNLYNKLYLVRTNYPHAVHNCENKMRYCLSVRGNPMLNNWEHAVKYFKKFI